MRASALLVLCWFFLGSPIPLRADEPAADLDDLSAWATNRLGDGFSCKPETLWGDLCYLRVTRDDAPVGLVYESIDRSGCGSCAHLDLRIAMLADTIVALDARRSVPGASGDKNRGASLHPVTELTGERLADVLAQGDSTPLMRDLERRLPGIGERLRDVAFLAEIVNQAGREEP